MTLNTCVCVGRGSRGRNVATAICRWPQGREGRDRPGATTHGTRSGQQAPTEPTHRLLAHVVQRARQRFPDRRLATPRLAEQEHAPPDLTAGRLSAGGEEHCQGRQEMWARQRHAGPEPDHFPPQAKWFTKCACVVGWLGASTTWGPRPAHARPCTANRKPSPPKTYFKKKLGGVTGKSPGRFRAAARL